MTHVTSEQRLCNVFIHDISIGGGRANLRFRGFVGDDSERSLLIERVICLRFCDTLGSLTEMQSPCLIGETHISHCSDGGAEVLSHLGYQFLNRKGVASHPEEDVVHIHIEGDVIIDIVGSGVSIVESVHGDSLS